MNFFEDGNHNRVIIKVVSSLILKTNKFWVYFYLFIYLFNFYSLLKMKLKK
jgi:hypothetical protein